MRRDKAYPYPEIVTGDKWTVEGTPDNSPAARTDNLNKQMHVPLDRQCENCGINHSRMIRRHELGHAKWSPKTMGKLKPGVKAEAIEVLEEIRVNYLLLKSKLPIAEPTECIEQIKIKYMKMVYESSLASLILYGLASMWMVPKQREGNSYYSHRWGVEYETLLECIDIADNDSNLTDLRKAELQFVRKVCDRFYYDITRHNTGQTPSYNKVKKNAEKLSAILDQFLDKPKPEEVFKPEVTSKGTEAEGEEETESEGDGESNELDGSVDSLERRTRKDLTDMIYRSSNGVGYWGEMETHNPPLTVNLQSRLKTGRAYRPADFGYNPKYINRYCIDKKIFKQKQRVYGGTILIDASGSMSFDGEDILEVMQELPAVTIAMYNGLYDGGHLRIIAKNGMRVTEEYLDRWSGGGNLVDGPALEWVGTMPARRIWVSDMHVFGATGALDGFNLLKEVNDLCKRHRIINLKDIEEVKEHALKLNM